MKLIKLGRNFYSILFILWIAGCTHKSNIGIAIQEIRDVETAFAKSAEQNGLAVAFYEYAAPDAVINRGTLIKGPEAIKSFYLPDEKSGVKLRWKPDYIDVSSSSDLGYTYGSFNRSVPDSTGKIISTSGTFHTVWKKQKDGSWKYVWD
ncbi:MAG: hypothetical protein ABIR66_08705 [Saprospiraceae bacterium]